eukprot:scaffold136305_cov33-Tisochrysis_lutea.AAC.1
MADLSLSPSPSPVAPPWHRGALRPSPFVAAPMCLCPMWALPVQWQLSGCRSCVVMRAKPGRRVRSTSRWTGQFLKPLPA